jgi:hypothetical protein
VRFDRAGLTDPVDDISLLGYPVRLGALQQQRQDEIVREFQFLAVSSPESSRQVPGQEEFLRQLDGQQPVRWSGPT